MPRHLGFPRPQIGRMGYPIKSGDSSPVYLPLVLLLEDRFTTANPTPLENPHTMEPGGTLFTEWAVTDPNSRASIASGKLHFTSTGSSNPMLQVPFALTRERGNAFYLGFWVNGLTVAANSYRIGYASVSGGTVGYFFSPHTSPVPSLGLSINAAGFFRVESMITGLQQCIVIDLNPGFVICVKGVMNPSWTLFAMHPTLNITGSPTTVFPMIASSQTGVNAIDYDADNAKLANLIDANYQVWNTTYGPYTRLYSGSVPQGTSFNHATNALFQFEMTVPATDLRMRFRIQDASNYWELHWAFTSGSSATLELLEVIAGTPTQRGITGSITWASQTISVWTDGNLFFVTSTQTIRISYHAASTLQAATGFELTALGGGTILNLRDYNRVLSGEALLSVEALENA